jgi:hypothetical protein
MSLGWSGRWCCRCGSSTSPVRCEALRTSGSRPAQSAAGRSFRLQVGIGAVGEGQGVCPLLPVMGSLPWPSWRCRRWRCRQHSARGPRHCLRLRRTVSQGSRKPVVNVSEPPPYRLAMVGARKPWPGAADQQLIDRLPGEAELAVEGSAEGGVVRVARRRAEGQSGTGRSRSTGTLSSR